MPAKKKKPAMEMVYVIYSNPIDSEVVETVQSYGTGYTKINDVQGEGSMQPQLGTHVWPGINNMMMIMCNSNQREEMVEEIMELKSRFKGIGISIYVTEVKAAY